MKVYIFSILLISIAQSMVFAQDLSTEIPAHDPVMIKQDSVYYLFTTGRGIGVWSSMDMHSWKQESRIFDEAPDWAVSAVAGFRNHVWAPDISFYNGKYYLYYSVSTFGKNTSSIGVATNTTLHPHDPAYKWQDHGQVIASVPGKTNWNAIDPNLIIGADGTPYLTFGSFWEGIKLVRLNKDGFSTDEPLDQLKTLAKRRDTVSGNPIEAPFIFKKEKYYYLFASIDYCCKGASSTYKMIVGRSEKLSGPYLDAEGNALNTGGGTLILAGNKDWYGVGHNAVCTFDGLDYLVFHGYDANDYSKAKLIVRQLDWKHGWPVSRNL